MCSSLFFYQYLVGGFNLKNMSSSVGMMTFPTEWKVRKVMFQTTSQGQSPWNSHLPRVFLWNHHFPMVFPWFSKPPTSNPPPKNHRSRVTRWSKSPNQVTRWSKSSPPKWVSPLVATTSKTPLSMVSRDTSKVPRMFRWSKRIGDFVRSMKKSPVLMGKSTINVPCSIAIMGY